MYTYFSVHDLFNFLVHLWFSSLFKCFDWVCFEKGGKSQCIKLTCKTTGKCHCPCITVSYCDQVHFNAHWQDHALMVTKLPCLQSVRIMIPCEWLWLFQPVYFQHQWVWLFWSISNVNGTGLPLQETTKKPSAYWPRHWPKGRPSPRNSSSGPSSLLKLGSASFSPTKSENCKVMKADHSCWNVSWISNYYVWLG